MPTRRLLALLSSLLLATGSSLVLTPAPRAAGNERPTPVAVMGAELYTQNCAVCHGAAGDGDGPASPGLNPKPRKFSDRIVMAGISDATIYDTIRKGGQAMGKSPAMPPFAQLDESQVRSLIQHIRSLAR